VGPGLTNLSRNPPASRILAAVAHALQLFFDSGTEAAVRAMWGNLEARGLRSMATTTHGRHRPHVSLAVAEHMSPAHADVAAQPLGDANDLALRLGSVAVFPGRQGVLYLSVVPTMRLLRLHREIHAQLLGAGVESLRHYLPDVWVPHCTLAQSLSPDQIPIAVRAVQRLRLIAGEASSVGMVDTDSGDITIITNLPQSIRAD
jgi:2'-5' RNA ligase